jgi:alkylhydroperoxidase family enzyme
MNARIDVNKYLTSNLGQAMLALSAASAASALERSLLELVRLRASQINHTMSSSAYVSTSTKPSW